MFKKIIAVAASVMLLSGAAHAVTYQIDSFVNVDEDGFRSTLFHGADGCGGLCGDIYDEAAAGPNGTGTWNTDTGEIEFVMNLAGGGTVEAEGLLNFEDPISPGIVGDITMEITGSLFGLDGVYDFLFQDIVYNAAAGVNGFADGVISLMGASGGTPIPPKFGGGFSGADLGVDLRIAVSVVPLPAPLLLLLSALGGLGLMARRRNAAA